MGRTPCCEKDIDLKKGPWTPEEDQKLIDYIQKHGYGNWRTLPKNAGLQRCGKSCRLRWTNYLRPDIKRGRFSFEEEETIIQLHSILGNKWSAIAARLPGRTDNEIKNYWNTHIRKRLLRMGIDPVTHNPRLDLLDLSSILGSSLCNPSQLNYNISRLLGVQNSISPELLRLANSLMSSSQRQSPNLLLPNVEEIQIPQLLAQPHQLHDHDQAAAVPVHEIISPCTTSTPSCVSFLGGEAQFLEANSSHQFPSNLIDFCSQNPQLTEWQSNEMAASNPNIDHFSSLDYVQFPCYDYYRSHDQPIMDPSSETSTFNSSSSNQNISFASVLSTPASSPTPLNSNSTYFTNGTDQDERESYCSEILMFEIPDLLDVNQFM